MPLRGVNDRQPDLVGFDPARDVLLDARSLRGIAHPLRTRILGLLRVEGPSTATRLAQRLGQSSGATSYHLRQLAAYGFVVEESRPGKRRERWWRAAHRSTWLLPRMLREEAEGEDTEALIGDYLNAVAATYVRTIHTFVEHAHTLPPEWEDAGALSDVALMLTVDEAVALRRELLELVGRYRRADAGDAPESARLVDVQWQLLPRIPE
jgi:DNA-binding transcriptional ArsR family regulator